MTLHMLETMSFPVVSVFVPINESKVATGKCLWKHICLARYVGVIILHAFSIGVLQMLIRLWSSGVKSLLLILDLISSFYFQFYLCILSWGVDAFSAGFPHLLHVKLTVFETFTK